MRHRKFFAFCLPLVSALLAAPSALADPICTTLTTGSAAVGDVYIASASPNTNFDGQGGELTGVGHHSATYDTLVHIDVSFIPAGATVTSATMTVQMTSTNPTGATVDVNSILGGWNPATVTWDDFSAGISANPVATFLTNVGPASFDLTALTQGWVNSASSNYGILLSQATGETEYDFSAADNVQVFNVCYAGTLNPSLSLQKTVSTSGTCPGATMVTVVPGTQITDCYAVTNTGNETISGVVVNDSGATVSLGTIAPGASASGSATQVVTSSVDTSAIATGTAGSAQVASGLSDVPVTVLTSSLSLQKTASATGTCPGSGTATVEAGSPVTYCYAVTNTGGLAINGVVVTDNATTVTIGNLAPGASGGGSTVFVAVADSDTPAVASGTDSTGAAVSSSQSTAMVAVVGACADGLQDGTETDVDCGGQCPVACLVGQACVYASDCQSDYCVNNICETPSVLDSSCIGDGTSPEAHNAGWPNHEAGSCDDGFEGFTIFQAAALCPGDVVKYFDYGCTDFPALGQRSWEADWSCCLPPGPASPLLALSKTVSTTGACPGEPSVTVLAGTPVVDCYTVTNTGDVQVDGITVSDNGATITIGDLAPGQSGSGSQDEAPTVNEDTVAVAQGTAVDTAGSGPVESPPANAPIYVVIPSLEIVKTASTTGACPGLPSVTVLSGTTVTYCYQVTNNGDTDVGGVTVTDTGVSITIGDLPAGATGSGSASGPVTSDTDTFATASGITVATDTPVTSPPSDASVIVVNPSLTIVKTESTSGTCQGSPSVTVLSGTPVTTCYLVTNNGDTEVDGVTVNDNGAVISIGNLGAGSSGTGSVTAPATANSDTAATAGGTVTATGTSVTSPPSAAQIIVVNPSLSIVKTVSTTGSCSGSGPSATVYAGTTVTYCYAVTNTGNTEVDSIVVNDTAISVSVGNLTAGQTGDAQANQVITANTNTPAVASGVVTATGTNVSSGPSSAAVTVVAPALSIAVSVSTDGSCPGVKVVDVEVGTPITWCYVVTNSGGTTVNDIQVTDDELGTVMAAPFTLTPGQSQTLSRADVAATSLTLSAYATGIDAVLGGAVQSPQDTAAVNIVAPSVNINVTISTNGTCPGTSDATVPAGETVTYCYIVTNEGDDTLYNVVVTTPSGTVIGTIPTLGTSDAVTLTTAGVLVVGNATVTATAAGQDAYGDSVSSTGTALLCALLPSLTIQKTVSTNGACPGSPSVTVLNPTQVTYCYLVTDSGQTGVNNIVVSDNGASIPVINLSPKQSQMVSNTVTATADADTSATAAGVNAPTGAPVSSNPSAASVTVVNPSLTVVKTVSLTGTCQGLPSVSVLAGTGVTYCYLVTNTGDTTISGVTVSDNGVQTTIGTLASGQTGSGSAPYTSTTTDADTSAVASGTVVATSTPIASLPSAALVHIVAPALSIVTTVSTTGACPGQPLVNVESGTGVLWCYLVTNTGNVAVSGITVTDDVYGVVPGASFSLSPGQSITVSRAAAPTVSTTVAASATGTDTVVGSTVTSNLSSAAVNIVAPKVNIVTTVSTSGACPGSPSVSVPEGTNVTYCYLVSNAGNDTLVNIEVENKSGTVLATIPSLAPGASDQITGATVPATINATVYGSAVATDSYGDSVSATSTALVTVLFADLVVTKTAPATINAGACPSLDYTIKVTNSGAVAAAAPVVTDVLPSGVTYVSATTTSGSCSFTGATNTVTCTLANLAAGASATITVDTTTLLPSGTITNTASVTTATPQSSTAGNTGSASTEIVAATCSSSGTISACFNGSTIQKGQTVWFTAVAQVGNIPQNTPSTLWSLGGNINFSCGGKSYTVPVPASQVTFDPTCNQATTSFDATHNQWNTRSSSSPNGNVFVAAVQWQAPENLPGGITPVTWSSNIVSNSSNLEVTWQWSASVYNQGATDYNSLGVKPLDDGSQCSGGSNWGQGWSSDPCGTPEGSKGNLCAGGRGNGQGNYCGQPSNPSCSGHPPVQACPSPVTEPLPDLIVTKSAPSTINAGACTSLPYTITVTNNGTATATSPVVTDALPSSVTYVSATTTSGSCSFASATNTVTCTLANLAAGASATVTINTTTLLPSGTITNTASVTTSTTQSSAAGNTASATTQVIAASCPSTGTIATGFNGSSIRAGETLWFTAVAEVSGIPGNTTSSLWSLGGNINFSAGGTSYTVPVPPGKVTFEPSCSQGSTSFDDTHNQWNTIAPCSFSGNVFVAAVAWQAPVNLPGGINPVTWSSNIVSNNSNLAVTWQWSAATYNQAPGDYNSLGVKPLDEGSKCGSGFNNSDPCGTPEGFKGYLCSGGNGNGNGNYCGQRSNPSNCGHPPVQACQ